MGIVEQTDKKQQLPLLAGLRPANSGPPQDAPNVLLIMTDDQGYGVSGTFGGVIPISCDRGHTLGPPGVHAAVPAVPDDRDRRRGHRRADHDQQVDPAALDGDSAVASLTRRLAVHQP